MVANRGFSSCQPLRDATPMKKVGDSFELSATDLVGYLNCHHLAGLDRAVAERGFIEAEGLGPPSADPGGTRDGP